MIGISLSAFVTQLIGVVIILFLLYRLLYKPVAKNMEDRSLKIKESLEAADRARAEVTQAGAEADERIREAQAQAQQIVSEARAAAQNLGEAEATKTQQRVAEMLAKAETDGERRKEQAIKEAQTEIGTLVALATEQLVRQKVDAKSDKVLVDKVVEEALAKR